MAKALPPVPPTSPEPIEPKKTNPSSNPQDVTIPWQKFLSRGENVATKQEAKMFIKGLMKLINVMIARDKARISKANEHLKRVIKGEE